MSIVKNFMLSTALLMSLQLSADFKLAGSSIYVGQDQPESVYEASEELQLHIKKATGLDLPIVYTPAKGKMIVVGDNELSRKAGIDTGKMEYQGHRILTKGNNLYIVGRDVAKDAKLKSGGYSFGTLYAVYSFLSRTMGIRWILPSDKGMHIPNLGKDYTVPDLDITYVPAFKARITYIPKVWMRSPEYRKWMQRNYHRLPNLRNVHDQVFGSLGIGFSHSWEYIYPKKKSALFESAFDTFKKHPDFFWANSAGKRMEPIHNCALCISNPELLKDISERYIKWAESKKAVHISISPSDGTACSCKNCTANPIDLSHIGEYRAAHVVKKGYTPLYLDYYRYVTEHVTKKYPEMLLTGLIYNTYLYAPKQKPARMPDNFIPWMAPLNISYGPSRIYEGINRSWHSWLDGWSGVFKNIAYFGYDFYLNTYGTNVPWPTMAPILNETLQTLRKNNCVGIFNAGLGALGTQGINNWLLLQSDFYPEDDYVKLAKLYNRLAYGKGGDEINQIYEILERNLKAYVTSVKGKMSYYITPELMKDVYAKDWNQIRALMVKAKAAPKDAGQAWRFEHFERNMKITEYFLRRMTMIPADEKSPLYISEKELLELRPRLGINADLEFYTEPLYSAAYASYIKQVVVKPTVLKGKEPFKSGTFFLSRDYVVYAPEDMEICMKFETGCFNTDPRTGKPYLKPMPQFQVLDSNRKTVCEGLGDLKDGSIRFKGKKGEHYYVIFAPTTAVEFNAYYRIISCNVPYAMGSYTRPNGFAVQRIKSPVKFYVNVPEGTEKFTFIAQLYATGHYKLISPNRKVVVENKKVTGYHPHEVNLKKQNLPAGIWTLEILHAHWGYLRFNGIPNFLIMDPEKALIVEETETVKKKMKNNYTKIAEFAGKNFLDKNGVFYTNLDHETYGPVTAQTVTGGVPKAWFSGFGLAEFFAYENAGMTTGSYMAALCLEGTPEERKKVYNGLKWLYETGKELEEGFIPKPYGGRFFSQTSTDQVLYVMYALDLYYPLADEAEKKEIRRMIVKMADFWMKRNYHFDYYHVKNMKWPPLRFPSLLMLAWKYSGEERYRTEAYRILDENIDWIPEHSKVFVRRGLSDFEKQHNIRIVNQAADAVSMDIMNLDLLIRCEPEGKYRERFIKAMEVSVKEGFMTICDNGRYEALLFYDMNTGKMRLPRKYEHPDMDDWKTYTSSWSTMIVRAALIASQYLPHKQKEIFEMSEFVLSKIGLENCHYAEKPANLCEHERYKYRLLSGDGISNWLWGANLYRKFKKQK